MTTPILEIPEIANNSVNQYLTANEAFRALEAASNDFLSVDLSAGNVTLTTAQFTRYGLFISSGNTVSRNVTVPASKRKFSFFNGGTFPVFVVRGTGSIQVPDGESVLISTDGTTNGIRRLSKTARTSMTIETDSTTARTLLLSDAGKYLRFTNASAIAVTVPANSTTPFMIGAQVHLRQAALGLITIGAAGGVTINTPSSGTLALAGQGATVTLIKVDTDEWDLMGQVAA